MGAVETELPPHLYRRESYRALPDTFDELIGADGLPRLHWRMLLSSLDRLPAEELRARRESARRLLREHGATYNVYADAQGLERPWSLDLLPFIVPPDEWRQIEAGLIQRAQLLNLLVADIYGAQRTISEGLLPPGLLFANPGFLRPCHQIAAPGGTSLFLQAVDLARAPDGRWWVLADRTQAPSGAGYALENRLVLGRVFPDEYRDCQVQRLAGFFQAARDHLYQLAPTHRGQPNVVLLTPGPYNETYFEQVFLARYLGVPLVEGGDLTVRDRRVYIKTLEGLQPVEAILRRLDDTFCDPLELRADSSLGVPGLVDAARAGNVAIANAIGSGVVEMPALLAFLPRLCRHFLGEELRLPNVATWWCGQSPELAYVREHLEQLVIKAAFNPLHRQPVFGASLDPDAQASLMAAVCAAPYEYVAQEQIGLSSAPVWEPGGFVPRPMVLRVFVCATADGYCVMPGGLTRFSASPDQLVVSMQSGGGSKDTWILADGPVHHVTLLKPGAQVVRLERAAAEVPSRVADNLFWLGRYAERLEDTVRLLRCVLNRLTGESGTEENPELTALIELLVALELFPAKLKEPGRLAGVEREVYLLIYQAHRLGTIREIISRLRNLAAVLRDRFSADTWNILSRLQIDARPRAGRAQATEALALLNALILDLAAFSGMEMENMTRGHGWRFLDIGRRLERAMNILTLVESGWTSHPSDEAVLEPMLEIADSVMTYRRRYFAQPQWPATVDLLLADETNPRSLAFQIQALADHAANLPREHVPIEAGPPSRQAAALRLMLAEAPWSSLPGTEAGDAPDAFRPWLRRFGTALRTLSDSITHLYFSHAETRPT